jgi:hypothetical protein|nr:MAG TPA: hypothetical protein [Caudoviricetes sp.]
MASNLDQAFMRDAENAIFNIVDKNRDRDAGFDEIGYLLQEDRRFIDKLVTSVCDTYTYYTEEAYRRQDTNWCFDEAVNYVLDVTRANIILKDRNLQSRYSDRQLDDMDKLIQDYRVTLREMDAFFRSGPSYDRRESLNRGVGNYSSNRDNQRRSGSMFRDDSAPVYNNRASTEAVTTNRAQRLAARNEARAIEQEQRQVESENRFLRGRTRIKPIEVEEPKTLAGIKDPEQVKHIRNTFARGISDRKLREFTWPVAKVDYAEPFSQRHVIEEEGDGYAIKAVGVNDMHPDAHERVIENMIDKHKDREFNNPQTREVIYVVDGIELPPSLVENSRVDAILQRMVDNKEVKEGTPFMKLPEDIKRRIIQESTDVYEFEQREKYAKERAEQIEKGTVNDNTLKITTISSKRDVRSLDEAISQAKVLYNYQLSTMDDPSKGYLLPFSLINPLYHCSSPSNYQLQSNLLVGLSKRSSTLDKIALSLKSAGLDKDLLNKLNDRATRATNIGITYILKRPGVVMDNFVNQIDDFIEYINMGLNDDRFTHAQVDCFEQYLVSQLGRMVSISAERLKSFYPEFEDYKLEEVVQTTILENVFGNIYFLPYSREELGFILSVNCVDISQHNTPFFNTIVKVADGNNAAYLQLKDGSRFAVYKTNATEYMFIEE